MPDHLALAADWNDAYSAQTLDLSDLMYHFSSTELLTVVQIKMGVKKKIKLKKNESK